MWISNVARTCMGVKPGERVLLVLDEPLAQHQHALMEAFMDAGAGEFWSFVIPDRTRPLSVFPPALHTLIETTDAALLLLAQYTPAKEQMALLQLIESYRRGADGRFAWGLYIDQAVLDHEMSADYNEVARVTAQVAAHLRGKSQIRITNPAGTDLSFSIAGRDIHPSDGMYSRPGTYGNLPDGEVYTAPLEDSADGVLVVDGSLPNIAIDEPVRMVFKKGRVVEIEGGTAAEAMRQRIQDGYRQNHGEWSDVIAELGVGTNPQARLTGSPMTDEKVFGTVHVAIGRNDFFGGVSPAPIHIDCIILKPTLEADGVLLMKEGQHLD